MPCGYSDRFGCLIPGNGIDPKHLFRDRLFRHNLTFMPFINLDIAGKNHADHVLVRLDPGIGSVFVRPNVCDLVQGGIFFKRLKNQTPFITDLPADRSEPRNRFPPSVIVIIRRIVPVITPCRSINGVYANILRNFILCKPDNVIAITVYFVGFPCVTACVAQRIKIVVNIVEYFPCFRVIRYLRHFGVQWRVLIRSPAEQRRKHCFRDHRFRNRSLD